ncbi:MAG: Crp/Fnr family transcriptional regulator [Thermaerobacter sp.]|nr:Crp/Fnr family transcriptional regulator [Thermaerobacter sp.]
MEDEKLKYLSRINIFSDLDKDTLQKLDKITPMVTVPRGAVITSPGDVDSVLYLLKRGRVRLYKTTPDGSEITLAMLGDGNVFGATGSLGLGNPDMYAEAIQSSLVCAMREEDVASLIQRNPAVGMRLISLLSQRVRELEEQVESLSHQDVEGRVLRLLVHLADDFGVADRGYTRLDVPLTHEEIATMVGSTRETVTTTLSHLGRLGLVRTGRREIAINRERVTEWLNAKSN